MFLKSLCGPAIVYIGFSIIQIIMDIYKNTYGEAFIKFIIMIILSIVLNILCNMGLSIIAWFIVLVPLILMTLISSLLVQVFNNKDAIKNIDINKIKKRKNKETSNEENKKINKKDKDKKLFYNPDNQYSSKYNKNINYSNYENEILNKNKNTNIQDNKNMKNQINRDKIREDLYTNIEDYYGLEEDDEKNHITFNALINWFGEHYFINSAKNYYNN